MNFSTFVERKNVKEYFPQRREALAPSARAEIKAPQSTTSYGWIGTAFDCAMRFYL